MRSKNSMRDDVREASYYRDIIKTNYPISRDKTETLKTVQFRVSRSLFSAGESNHIQTNTPTLYRAKGSLSVVWGGL